MAGCVRKLWNICNYTKNWKIYLLGDALWRSPYGKGEGFVNDIEVPSFSFEDIIKSYEDDPFYVPVVKALNGKWPEKQKQNLNLEETLSSFKIDGKICVPRMSVSLNNTRTSS